MFGGKDIPDSVCSCKHGLVGFCQLRLHVEVCLCTEIIVEG